MTNSHDGTAGLGRQAVALLALSLLAGSVVACESSPGVSASATAETDSTDVRTRWVLDQALDAAQEATTLARDVRSLQTADAAFDAPRAVETLSGVSFWAGTAAAHLETYARLEGIPPFHPDRVPSGSPSEAVDQMTDELFALTESLGRYVRARAEGAEGDWDSVEENAEWILAAGDRLRSDG
ncbi:hypothetical protein [Rubrivirga sp.]|uniref:hypothetical protein n=1 Tax=Rubrivirga sp. TaxID=1885344 RepID=UPI003B519012